MINDYPAKICKLNQVNWALIIQPSPVFSCQQQFSQQVLILGMMPAFPKTDILYITY